MFTLYLNMVHYRFERLPAHAFSSFGGFTWVKPQEWRHYLEAAGACKFKPGLSSTAVQNGAFPWQENNCIFTSLADYLLDQFGVLVPDDSLFKYYNPEGQGILPGEMLEAISAVIEPLGYEIERVLVPDEELRSGLGNAGKTVDLSHAAEFDGRAGICMIHIKDGYSHAFYWKSMEKSRFRKEQFRLAVLVRKQSGEARQAPSALRCFEDYCRLLDENLTGKDRQEILARLDDLKRLVQAESFKSGQQRSSFDRELAAILAILPARIAIQNRKENRATVELVEEAGQAVRRIFQYRVMFS